MVTVATTTTTTTKEKQSKDMKKATKIQFTQKTPMVQPTASVFSQVLEEITKTGNQTRKTVRERNINIKCLYDKCKSLPMFATQTVVILPEEELGTTSLSLPNWA
jgi:hypothetical protein